MVKKYSGPGKFLFFVIVWLFLLPIVIYMFSLLPFFYLVTTMEINSATSSVIRDANLLTLIKKTTDNNNKNYRTKLVAEKFDKNCMVSEEILGERMWKEVGFLGEPRTDYSMEKVNFPENSLIYINQAYLTI